MSSVSIITATHDATPETGNDPEGTSNCQFRGVYYNKDTSTWTATDNGSKPRNHVTSTVGQVNGIQQPAVSNSFHFPAVSLIKNEKRIADLPTPCCT